MIAKQKIILLKNIGFFPENKFFGHKIYNVARIHMLLLQHKKMWMECMILMTWTQLFCDLSNWPCHN